MTIDATGWGTIAGIGSGAAMVATLFINQYFAYKQNQLQMEKLDRIQKTGEKTASAVDGQLSASLVTGAVSARALAVADPSQLNHELAAAATKVATDHMATVAATKAQDAAATEAAKGTDTEGRS